MNYLLISFPSEEAFNPNKLPNTLMATDNLEEAQKWQKIFQKNRHKEKIILVPIDVEGYQIPAEFEI